MTGLSKKPILILGIGNRLLSDDGVGLHLLKLVETQIGADHPKIDFVDGGTQGIALLGIISERDTVIILDAVSNGADPGTIHRLTGDEMLTFNSVKTTAHESSANDILKTALLTGDMPKNVIVIGIEPEKLNTNIGLSETVSQKLDTVVQKTVAEIDSVLHNLD